MTWDQVVTSEAIAEQIKQDHGTVQADHEIYRYKQVKDRLGVSFTQGYRVGWWDAVFWVLRTQAAYDDLTADEAIAELRKGEASIYYPIKMDDPRLWIDCPGGHKTLVDAQGICDACGREVI